MLTKILTKSMRMEILSMSKKEKDMGSKKFALFTLVILLVIPLMFATTGCGLAAKYIATGEKILDPEKALQRWQWFYDTKAFLEGQADVIEQYEKSIEELKEINGEPQGWDWQTKDEYQRLVATRDGIIANYNRVAQEYNAKMRDITRSFIRPPELPREIPNWGE